RVAPATTDVLDNPTLEPAPGAYGLPPRALDVYRASRPGASPGDLLAAVVTDWFFAIPSIRVAEARARQGTARSWSYRFDHPDAGDNNRLGACHGVEVPFV